MSSPHAVLRPAERARVIASLSTPASWIPADGGEPLHLPFIDQAGTPLLLVPTDLASELREAG